MSHISKNPIIIPNNIKIELNNNYLIVIGKLGIQIKKIPKEILIQNKNKKLYISVNSSKYKSIWGTYRMLINNMIIGVNKGFLIKLKIVGIGYRAYNDHKYLRLKIGRTNIVKLLIPSNIKIKCVKFTKIYLYGSNLQQIKLFAYKIRSFKKPDPYKGKGILFVNEVINFKEGKKK